jgi:hypothetical protein
MTDGQVYYSQIYQEEKISLLQAVQRRAICIANKSVLVYQILLLIAQDTD